MNDTEFQAKQEKRRRLWETPMEQWAAADLIEELRERYTADPVPPCRVCGGELSVQSIGGSSATVWACSGMEDDPEHPGHSRYKADRRPADDHYSQSRWIQHRDGDRTVLELIRRFENSHAEPTDRVQMPEKARAGIEVLHEVVEKLLTTSCYVDEEGEATFALSDLLSCIAEPPFRLTTAGTTTPRPALPPIARDTLRRWIAALEIGVARMTKGQRNEHEQALTEMHAVLSCAPTEAAAPAHASSQPLLDALERISKRCPTDHADYTTASIGDTARNALAAYGTQRSAVSDELASLLRIWQSHLGASREQCDEPGGRLWDRIEAALSAGPAPALPPLTKLQAEFTFASGRTHTLLLWGSEEHIDALQVWLLRTAGETVDGTAPQIEPIGYIGDVRNGAMFFIEDPDDVGIAVFSRPQLHAAVQEAVMVANAREGRHPGFVLLPVMPEGVMRETLLRALEDAGPSEWAGTVKGAAGQLYDALIKAARTLTKDVPHPVFATGVARRKWESLQGDGYRMQRIEFSRDDGRRGTIDPWGKVLWISSDYPLPQLRGGIATATSNGAEQRYEVRFSFPTLHEMQAAHNEWVHFAAACRGVPDPAAPKR